MFMVFGVVFLVLGIIAALYPKLYRKFLLGGREMPLKVLRTRAFLLIICGLVFIVFYFLY